MYIKAVYCHPAYLTYMQSTSCEIPTWMKHKLKSRKINNFRYANDTTLKAESKEKLKTVLMTVALYYNLKSGRLIPPAPFFFLKTALVFGIFCVSI